MTVSEIAQGAHLNEAPKIRDEAIWRRIRVIPLDHSIPAKRQDRSLKRFLRDPETGGTAAFSWAVAGAVEWYRDGLGICEVVEDATREYRAAEDVFGQFLAEKCELRDDYAVSAPKLRYSYDQWRSDTGAPELSAIQIGYRIKERRLKTARSKNKTTYKGVRVKGQKYEF